MLGLTVEEFSPLLQGERVRVTGPDGSELTGDVWTEFVVPRGAETVWTLRRRASPRAAPPSPGTGSARAPPGTSPPASAAHGLDALLGRAADGRADRAARRPAARRRGGAPHRRVGHASSSPINHTAADAKVPLDAPGTELLTGERAAGPLAVPGGRRPGRATRRLIPDPGRTPAGPPAARRRRAERFGTRVAAPLLQVPRHRRRDDDVPPRRTLRALLIPLVAGLALTALPASPAQAAATLTNPGFESDGAGTATPAGWSTYSAAGQNAASFTESGGHSGGYRLTHWSASAYKVETYQYLSGLTNGNYTLTAWVRSGGGQNSAYLALRNCGGAEQRTDLPVSASGWIRIVTPVAVTGSQCTISINSDANAGNWINVDDLTFTSGTTGLGHQGRRHLVAGQERGLRRRLQDQLRHAPATRSPSCKSAGMNYARLKVWVNPADGYNNKARVLAMAKRVKAQGMKLLVDFHYSDTWADPGKQNKPAAWAGHSYSQLKTDVYNHTYDVLNALKAQGTTADMVQIGNEINGGMLLARRAARTTGRSSPRCSTPARARPRRSPRRTAVVLHLAEGGDNARHPLVVRQARSPAACTFDVIGLSYYGYWHGSLYDLQTNLDDAASRYGKPVFVAETAYAFRLDSDDSLSNIINTSGELVSGYPATPPGRSAWLRDVMNIVEAVPNGRGLGVFYWEPPGPPSPATAGTRPTRPPATAGRTRPCSTTTTRRCRR